MGQAGLEKRNRLLNAFERKVVAFHEMGHALAALSVPGADPVHKISMIPRGVGALGYTIQRPTHDRFLMMREELENKMAVLLGGRPSEQLVFGHLSTGAADDLAQVTDIARSMVMRYGMEEKLGHVAYESERPRFLDVPEVMPRGREFSEEIAREIDRSGHSVSFAPVEITTPVEWNLLCGDLVVRALKWPAPLRNPVKNRRLYAIFLLAALALMQVRLAFAACETGAASEVARMDACCADSGSMDGVTQAMSELSAPCEPAACVEAYAVRDIETANPGNAQPFFHAQRAPPPPFSARSPDASPRIAASPPHPSLIDLFGRLLI